VISIVMHVFCFER